MVFLILVFYTFFSIVFGILEGSFRVFWYSTTPVICGKTSLHWPLKRATCTDFVTKSSTSLYFLQQLSTIFQGRFDAWVVKHATSLLNSFCSNIAKQATCFFCPFYRGVTLEADLSKCSHHREAKSRKLSRLPSSACYRGWS